MKLCFHYRRELSIIFVRECGVRLNKQYECIELASKNKCSYDTFWSSVSTSCGELPACFQFTFLWMELGTRELHCFELRPTLGM